MENLNVEKIEQKKTKTVLTVSFDTKEEFNLNSHEAFRRLLTIAVVSGGSTNCMRAALNGGLSQELDFELMKSLKFKMDALVYEAEAELKRVEKIQGMETQTKRFI